MKLKSSNMMELHKNLDLVSSQTLEHMSFPRMTRLRRVAVKSERTGRSAGGMCPSPTTNCLIGAILIMAVAIMPIIIGGGMFLLHSVKHDANDILALHFLARSLSHLSWCNSGSHDE
jgi:hypothetical protein